VHGAQTAIVVGLGAPVHTDRDHRIKLQFHWQRGSNSSHRLTPSPAGAGEGRGEGGGAPADNAPASDASGTWVRVAQSVAGANWGAVFTPRLGQEVLVEFLAGDIDRPLVVGSLYNGQGRADAQGNQVAAGAAGATGNAPAWFPGSRRQGQWQGHQHGAVLAGYKSQELSSSQNGGGGHNQLVFDDSPGAGRIELASTSAATRLQLGHLLDMNGNQRLQPRGHGLDLSTEAHGAVRAGSGLLLSAHGRPGSQSTGHSLDSREPRAQLEESGRLLHSLAESAQQHGARLAGEPDVVGAGPHDTPRQLPNEQGLAETIDSLSGTDTLGTPARLDTNPTEGATGGGAGSVGVFENPELVIAAPSGIAALTPAGTVMAAGGNLTLVAGQDVQHLAQANHATAVGNGLVLYTHGKATDPDKPNRETGIALHAASGNVSMQSQGGATRLTADRAVEVGSTTGMVKIAAPEHILLTAAGAAVEITSAGITLEGPGKIEFRAGMKELTGGASASTAGLEFAQAALRMPKRPLEVSMIDAYGDGPASEPLQLSATDGSTHSINVSSSTISIDQFKPGRYRVRQTKRKT
jgi:type VI secretion system secreted protein VgrG